MNTNAELLIGVAAALLASVAVFAVYHWVQISRQRQVGVWVREYVKRRFAEAPSDLRIDCTNDRLWPVLVDFEDSITGTRHSLQFICPGSHSTFALLSEKEEKLDGDLSSERVEHSQVLAGAAK